MSHMKPAKPNDLTTNPPRGYKRVKYMGTWLFVPNYTVFITCDLSPTHGWKLVATAWRMLPELLDSRCVWAFRGTAIDGVYTTPRIINRSTLQARNSLRIVQGDGTCKKPDNYEEFIKC